MTPPRAVSAWWGWVRLLLLAVIVGVASFTLTRWLRPVALAPEDELAWLGREFQLSAAQLATIEQLRADYAPVCARHCAAIQALREQLARLDHPSTQATTQVITTQRAALQAEQAALAAICRAATLAHLQEVAAVLPQGQRERFLALVTPQVSSDEHAGPAGLR